MNVAQLVLFASLALSPQTTHVVHDDVDASPTLVEQVRQATAPFLDIAVAMRQGNYGQFLGCVSGPQESAMGVHFVNGSYVGDGDDVNRPEALIYEFKDGVARLVGVEYIVMVDDWEKRHKKDEVPVLEGQLFQHNGSPNRYGLPAFYELHVWAWRDNPHGAFVDWNPAVSCEGR